MSSRQAASLRWSTIGRAIDLRVPTNLAIAVLSLASFIAGGVIVLAGGGAVGASVLAGLSWAGALFLGWALARELDPDRWASAFFAAAGALAGAILLGKPHFLMLFWFLIAIRFINRSTGLAPGLLDFGAYYGIKLWLGLATHWTIPLLTLPTMLFADLQRLPTAIRILLALMFPATGLVLGFLNHWHLAPMNPVEALIDIRVVVAVSLPCMAVIHSYRNVRSYADKTGEPLQPHRVQWALAWAVSAAIVLMFGTELSLQEMGPLWAALAGTGLGWAWEMLNSLARRQRGRT